MEFWKKVSQKIFTVQVARQPSPTSAASKILSLERAQQGLISIIAGLMGLGIMMIYSTSAFRRLDVLDPTHHLRRQILWALLGVMVMLIFWHTDYRQFKKYNRRIFLAIMAALVLVLIPGIGTKVYGARRWIRIAGIGIQPSEIAKICSMFFAASYISNHRKNLDSFKEDFLPVMIPISLLCALVMVEPDLGTAVFIFTISSAILLAGGMPLKHFLPLILAGMPLAFVAMFFKFSHIKARLLVFLYPDLDPYGKGHQIRQSLVALGSGGWTGNGIGASRQKLFFLPEDHTDFILAIVGEELGLWGTLMIVFFFIGLVYFGKRVMNMAPDLFGHLLAFGITFAICLQAVMNIAVVTASMPTKGISLPFVSYGGSSMVCTMAGVGILLNIAKTRRTELCLTQQKSARTSS